MSMARSLYVSATIVLVFICLGCVGGGKTTARFYNLGMSAYLSGEYLVSAEQLEKVLAENPTDHRSLYLLALDYAALDDQDHAIELLEKAVSIERREPQYLTALAILYHNRGKADAARQCLLAVQKIAPEDADVELLLGRIDLEQGDEKSASAHLEKALALQPQHPEARELLKSLGISFATQPKTE